MAFDIANALLKERKDEKGYYYGKCACAPYSGDDLFVTYAAGHLYGLGKAIVYGEEYEKWNMDTFPCIPNKYEVVPIENKYNKERISVVNHLFCEADLIINACDAGREGELIFTYIYDESGAKVPYKRLWLQAFTSKSIQKAFKEMRTMEEQKNAVIAARLRAIADWLIGINGTVFCTCKMHIPGESGVISIGRVQTPALSFVAERELEIRNFKKEKYWAIGSKFTTSNGETFAATCKDGKFKSEEECNNVIGELPKEGVVTEYATKKYKYSAMKTLNILQSLYEKKYITYPRTDAKWLPEDMKSAIIKVLNRLKEFEQYKEYFDKVPSYPEFTNRHFSDAKLVKNNEDHHAIVPTGKVVDPSTLSAEEANIYDLICKSVIRMIFPKLKYEKASVKINCGDKIFTATGASVLDYGWCFVDAMPKLTTLPNLTKGEKLSASLKCEEKETKPPPRYTDETLPKVLSKAEEHIEDKELAKILKGKGIGRPATTAEMIERLIERGYMVRQKNIFVCTNRGIYLYEKMPVEEFKKPDLTAKWEMQLEDIASGKSSPTAFLREVEQKTRLWCSEIKQLDVSDAAEKTREKLPSKCPVCGKNVYRVGIKYACEGTSDQSCYFSIPAMFYKKKIELAQAERLVSRGKTIKLKGFKSKKGNKFDAVLVWDEEADKPYSRLKFQF